jgi:hypothetical protein
VTVLGASMGNNIIEMVDGFIKAAIYFCLLFTAAIASVFMLKRISNFLKDLLRRSPRNADQPYIPRPPEQNPNCLTGQNNIFYQETNLDIETIAGTPLSFGINEKVVVDENGNAARIRQEQAHILGSGRLVSSLNPTIEQGMLRAGVGGVCYVCKQEAGALLESGLITIEEAHGRALFDTDSAAQCDGCGRRDLCVRHCRPFQRSDGAQLSLCPDCTKVARREKWIATSLNILLSPFIDEKKLPPPEQEGK